MRAIKLFLLSMAGLIASSTLAKAAEEWEAIMCIVYGIVLVWIWSLTNFGHVAAMNIFEMKEAELGTLRATVAIVFITGLLVNWSFEGFPSWIKIFF